MYLPSKANKINKWDYIKLKCFGTARETIKKKKKKKKTHGMEWEDIFTDTSDKGLITKINKKLNKTQHQKSKQSN